MKRWFILTASIILQIILGGIYAWSVFGPSLKETYHISISQSSFIFGVTILAFTLNMIYAGRVLSIKGPRFTAFIGGLLYTLGYLIASFSKGAYPIILLAIGLITGAGIGFGYVCPLTTCIKWFPERKGLITGLAVAGFGGGAIILTRFVSILQNNGLDTLLIFRNIAIYTGLPAIIAALFLSNPPENDREKNNKQKMTVLLRNKITIAMIIGMFSGTFGGLMVVSNIKQIGLSNHLIEQYAVLAISLFAVGNALGRILWGAIFDRVGKISIPISLVLLGCSALLMLSNSAIIFNLAAIMTGIAFGGCFVLYFLRIVEHFGDLAGKLYPFVFLAYGISAILGPALGGWTYDQTGTYKMAIYTLLFITLLGAISLYQLEKTK
ncbi:MFS transporter [Iocasia frigidifontis]|uniref:MFS transporter n=1 Tax=Iocasia fonsfrigidae TaxID=2682810 RepID=A0A8A7KFF4_9FIRM|nr:MFS transporter [Iocasia fonsfrigidae]QTL97627.1 MFS transporter [Iocasia fonsfrigidae]